MNLVLLSTAASIGVFHTAIGVDHYLPFVAMGTANRWSFRKTMLIAFACGIGHILSSVLLGLLGIFIGSQVSVLVGVESIRGDLATWFLIAFGLIYMIWGIRKAVKNKPHKHILKDGGEIWHGHGSADKHRHNSADGHGHNSADGHGHGGADEHGGADGHGHGDANGHGHGGADGHGDMDGHDNADGHGIIFDDNDAHSHNNGVPKSFWPLFVLFVLGPCEPLIPLLMYPAVDTGLSSVAVVAIVFGLCTIVTMLTLTAILLKGVSYIPMKKAERYSHALAGFAVLACGLAIQFLGI